MTVSLNQDLFKRRRSFVRHATGLSFESNILQQTARLIDRKSNVHFKIFGSPLDSKYSLENFQRTVNQWYDHSTSERTY